MFIISIDTAHTAINDDLIHISKMGLKILHLVLKMPVFGPDSVTKEIEERLHKISELLIFRAKNIINDEDKNEYVNCFMEIYRVLTSTNLDYLN